MIWDVDSYIVYEPGPIAIQWMPVTRRAPIDEHYRERVQETYRQMVAKQTARYRKWNGTKS